MQLAENLIRLGTETAFEVLARAGELERQGKDIINLGIGQPDFQTPDHIVEAAVKALRDGHHGYTPANGILPLREAVAADLNKRHRVEVDPNDVVVVPGGKVVFIDYHKPHWAHPLRFVTSTVFRLLEPFAKSLWRTEIETLFGGRPGYTWTKETYFGGLFQKVVARRDGETAPWK